MRLKLACIALTAIAALVVAAVAQAPLDIRVALVIGNSAYSGTPFASSANDAKTMANFLRDLGWMRAPRFGFDLIALLKTDSLNMRRLLWGRQIAEWEIGTQSGAEVTRANADGCFQQKAEIESQGFLAAPVRWKPQTTEKSKLSVVMC